MNILKHFAILLFLFSTISCSDHFISDRETRKQVESDLSVKLDDLNYRDQFADIIKLCDNKQEIEAIKFLYAYMPIGDMADYTPEFYINSVRLAFEAIQAMPWGKSVPDEIFRHFVLPPRVNNEDLDDARGVFFGELRDRVQGMSMYDAALEVNHWCHEKVIYTPSDIRTSSPLATVRTAYGRCGEESVFTVAALRSVGIPARQVYTPRWAHTDDNHAWVEVWIDGKWHYLGACEPEPELNVAWFSSTAGRGMLMHCKVFGYYNGDEQIIRRTDCITEINVTSNYADVEAIEVRVIDRSGAPVPNAKVEYKIYNYAEFYSAITNYTDAKGLSGGTFGLGDILVWASDSNSFGFKKISVGKESYPVDIILDKQRGELFDIDIDMIPPVEVAANVVLTQEQIAENKRRLALEDSIRSIYTSSFAKESDFKKLTEQIRESDKKNGINKKSDHYKRLYSSVERHLTEARGNWREIYQFYASLPAEKLETGITLLDVISQKDLRDTPADVLLDHLLNYNPERWLAGVTNSKEGAEIRQILREYLLKPRVGFELLTPWRGYFRKNLNMTPGETTALEIAEYVKQIKVFDNYNPQEIPIRPTGVHSLMAGDKLSKEVLFITICRSMDIPARKEEVAGAVQYYDNGSWHEVALSETESITTIGHGYIDLAYTPDKYIDDPKVDIHFTIASLRDNIINTLNFRTSEGFEGTMSVKSGFSKPVPLDAGYYMLTSGTRMSTGRVLVNIRSFNIEENNTTDVTLIMRKDASGLQVIGSFNPEERFLNIPGAKQITSLDPSAARESSILDRTGRGSFVIGFVRASHEPSIHAVRGIFQKSWDKPVVLLYGDLEDISELKKLTLTEIPQGVSIGVDKEWKILNSVIRELKLKDSQMPVFIIGDSFGRILFCTQGYNIGTADQLQKHLSDL